MIRPLITVIALLTLAAAFFVPQHIDEGGRFVRARVVPPPPHVTILFAGDIMLDRSLRVAMEENGEDHPFSCLGDTLRTPDLTVANLEGPITGSASRSVGSAVGSPDNTRFTFASSTAQLLARQGIDVVSLANNHLQDFGREGVRSTMRFLDEAGVGHFGDPLSERVHTEVIKGLSFTFIGYNEFQGLEDGVWSGSTTTLERIRAAREAGSMPIVFAHWGEEYVAANEEQKRLARSFIDGGAELVIGAHPHVIQEREEYQGKYIYYSLGNFIFDQYWEDAVRTGLLVRVEFGKDGVRSLEEQRTILERDRRTCLIGT